MQNFAHTIWMGDLEPYMDENFIKRAFETLGEVVVSCKVIRNKVTGQTMGYGFVEFASGNIARDAMLKFNGKPIPGVPSRRFKLNHASYGKESSTNDFSLFVGELTEDVDDLAVYNCFKKYPSCRSAKVVMNGGKSRGYGFVRFADENDADRALIEMQNHCGLGYKPIRVSLAIPKRYGPDGSVILGTAAETGCSLVPAGMPDPFTAAVAAAVTGSSAAQAEYYQAYQQYYQQYYAQRYSQLYAAGAVEGDDGEGGAGAGDGPDGEGTGTGATAAAGASAGAVAGDGTDEDDAETGGLDDEMAGAVRSAGLEGEDYVAAVMARLVLRQYGFPVGHDPNSVPVYEQTPDPLVLSSAFDKPRHVDDLGEVFSFIESSRWNFADPSLSLVFPLMP